MTVAELQRKFRADYRPAPFVIDKVELDFHLADAETLVTSRLELRRRPESDGDSLQLDGEELELRAIRIDGRDLEEGEYSLTSDRLTVHVVPDRFVLETVVSIRPQDNTQLSGLYRSGTMYCTQCEAEGFRRITWFLDRPDVMTTFLVRIEADADAFPVLLSNGNRIEAGRLDGGRHYSVWEDPFPKPSYLFALVAGDLGSIESRFTTRNGREVALHIYTEHRNVDQLDYAMEALKRSMTWDEEVFRLEYDLDIFNIVAVGDFNMGAMENKSLNIFNTGYVLARPEIATDGDYEGIEGVIGHEYFHNWTGNRVTCRDWFQLTLKEGLTVFRDQQFSADMGSAPVKRIEDVKILRAAQFREDSGPMAHPIRPESYVAMDNFYTVTVYNKGAEVIRMIHTLVGVEGFRKGMDLYFQRHDGQAVTCDDFRAAMADANGMDLSQFERWYLQAGTPTLKVTEQWDEAAGRLELTLQQHTDATPGQAEKLPFHIPVAVGLMAEDGRELSPTRVLELREACQTFTFEGLAARPVASVLRGFSAPVQVDYEQSDADLAVLFAFDTDSFNRWDAGQRLATRALLQMVREVQQGAGPKLPDSLKQAYATVLADAGLDPSLKSYALRLPDESTLGAAMEVLDPDAVHQARKVAVRELAAHLSQPLAELYDRLQDEGPYRPEAEAIGRRRMRNLCMAYLSSLEDEAGAKRAVQQYRQASNMTDQFAALACLTELDIPERQQCLDDFYGKWKDEALVVDKWLAVQACSTQGDSLAAVEALLQHESFDIKNPNKVRALIRSFASTQVSFHRADGGGYRFLADRVLELDPANPQIAARLAGLLSHWRRVDPERQALMKEQLHRIASGELSKDTAEIVQTALKDS